MRGLDGLQRWTLDRLPLLYLAWAIVVGVAIAWVTPAWQNPDEAAHVERIVQISLGGMVGFRSGATVGGLTAPAIDKSAAVTFGLQARPNAKISASMARAAGAVRWAGLAMRSFSNTAAYPPFLYAAAVPAAWIGRWGRLSVVGTLRLIRMFDVIAAAALGALALAVARRTKLAIGVVLLLPMSIALAASASQDALLIPVAALGMALLDRARAQPGQYANRTALLATALALTLVAMARPPYLALLALLLLFPAAGPRLRWGLMLAGAAATLLWTAYTSLHISVPMHTADPSAQAAFLLHHPFAFFRVLSTTLRGNGRFYVGSTIGVLGWLDAPLPRRFVSGAAWVVLLGLASAATPDAQRAPWWRGRAPLGLAATLAATGAVFLSLYVIWSSPGEPAIEGIQGRYFLPLLPALAFAMPTLGRWASVLGPPALIAALLLAVATPAATLTTLVDRYYQMP